MDVENLGAVAEDQLELARVESSGRHSVTLMGDRASDLRQTVIALAAGHRLHDHESPGEATLQVISGELELGSASGGVTLSPGDYLVLPPERHGLHALADSAMLLTVATRA
ncbi:cupin domain-containing protein [Demequina gelatinilytica]|uniref:cupin domain-containing protein n=1 Tax=Demequina gelatinilytica TaxID=1638980 RepID=UPI000784B752|nr:cupin domain-containing protein [Demequina gelatinilytica]